jgi:membrane-associated phospholipid phosphatase
VTRRRHRSPTAPLVLAAAFAVTMALTAARALARGARQERDAAMMHGFVALDAVGRPRLHAAIEAFAGLGDPLPYAAAGLAFVVVALRRGLRARAAAVAALLVVTGVSTQVVKHILAEPRFEAWLGTNQVGETAWPSGHSTAAMTLALCAVLVVPPALRALTAVAGGAFAAGVGYAMLVLAWHYPSDVLGGFLMAGLWTALAVAALRVVEDRPVAEARPAAGADLRLAVGLAAGAAAVAAAVALAASDTAALYASERPTLVAGALAIAAVAGALAVGLARAA